MISRTDLIRDIRVLRQLVHYFKWKIWKYQEASEVYISEGNYETADICEKNVSAFTKSVISTRNRLKDLEIKLESL